MRKRIIDDLDLLILEQLLKDARIPNKKLAKIVGLSPAPTLTRVKNLFARGTIAGTSLELRYPIFGLKSKVCFELVYPEKAKSEVLRWTTENPFVFFSFDVVDQNHVKTTGLIRHYSPELARKEVSDFIRQNSDLYVIRVEEVRGDFSKPTNPWMVAHLRP